MPLPAGTPAPDFTLKTKTAEGLEPITLSAHHGKDVVVLLFFPAVNTPVCTHEMCHAGDEVPALEDAVVYGISADLPYAQEMWAKVSDIVVPILSDHTLEVTKAYDALWPDFSAASPSPPAPRSSSTVGVS